MEIENVKNIELQRQGMNDTQQGFYQPMTGLSMQNRIPMNVTIPYNHMQGFLEIQGNPNTFNQQQVISNDDMQKSTEYLNKLRENSINKREEQIIQLGKQEFNELTNIDTNEKEELKKEDENLDKRIEMLVKGNTELFKIYAEYIGKEETEIKDSEKKESNDNEKKKPKKESLQDALEKSQKALSKGITKLTKHSDKRKKEISTKNTERRKDIAIRFTEKKHNLIINSQNDYNSILTQVTLMGVAETNRNVKKLGMVTLEQNNKLDNITQGIEEVNSNAKGLENFINSEYTNTKIENQQLHNTNQELTNRNVQIETTNQMLNLTVNQKDEQITSLQTQNNNLQSGNTILQNSVNTLQQQNSEKQQRINELEEKNNLLKKTIDTHREEIEKIMKRENNTNDIRAIYLTALTGITQEIGKEFIYYLSKNFFNVDQVNRLNESELVNSFYTQNIEKHLNITVNGEKISIIEIGKNLGFNEENFKIFIIEHLKNAFYSYMLMLSQTNPKNENASIIEKQSNDLLNINNNNTSESIVKEIRMIITELFSKMYPQQGYPQQQMSFNPFGGFNNYIPFMGQPQYQGYSQQQYIPQQNTTQFINQTQYQQSNNGMQNQQPDIKMHKITMPTGSVPNMTNNQKEEFKQEYSYKQQEVPQNTSINNTYQIPEETNSNDIYIFNKQINKDDLKGNNRIPTLLILYTELMEYLRKKLKSVDKSKIFVNFINSLYSQGYGTVDDKELDIIHKTYMESYKNK